jgi:uncharacterized damage-inducible protein DinB
MREMLEAIEGEYRRYKRLGESAFEQLTAEDLAYVPAAEGNSVAMIVWHVSGNLKSRFTDFLTSDGEKPWRQRDSEFEERTVTPEELRRKWDDGWSVLFAALEPLTDADLQRQVSIRGETLPVRDALLRSVTHTSHHVGQIVLLGKSRRGAAWRTLSIPKSQK